MIDIKYYRKLKNVTRMPGAFIHQSYNLLEHQYMVGMLFQKFAKLDNVSYDINDLNIVLHHDIVETVTGDLSWVVKNFNQVTKNCWATIEEEVTYKHFQLQQFSDEKIKFGLTELQYLLFKSCDVLDLFIFIYEEIKLGNRSDEIIDVYNNCLKIFDDINIKNNFPHLKKAVDEFKCL
jgi:5'-deoxynucleotidase YfbR-like HD superfamily hydrolase